MAPPKCMGVLPRLYCNQDFCIKHSGILCPVPKSFLSDAVSQYLHMFQNVLEELYKGNTESLQSVCSEEDSVLACVN